MLLLPGGIAASVNHVRCLRRDIFTRLVRGFVVYWKQSTGVGLESLDLGTERRSYQELQTSYLPLISHTVKSLCADLAGT